MDDRLKGSRIRQRGPAAPRLPSDAAEVLITVEIVGEFLGIDTDPRASASSSPSPSAATTPPSGSPPSARSTAPPPPPSFARQAADLWRVKESAFGTGASCAARAPRPRLRSRRLAMPPPPACSMFARAHRCRRASAARGRPFGSKDTSLLRQTSFYGSRVHARVCWPGGSRHPLASAWAWPPPTPTSFARWPTSRPSPPPACSSGSATTTRPGRKRSWRRWAWSLWPPVLLQEEERPDPREERRLPRPASPPDRHRLFAARGALLREAGVGARAARGTCWRAGCSGRSSLSHTVAFLLNHRSGGVTGPSSSRSSSPSKPAHRVNYSGVHEY